MELVFNGEDKGAHHDALLMGVSLVLELMGKVEHPIDGMQAAATIIDNGTALNYLNNFKEYFDKSE